jgi:hypothetical protein
MHHRKTFPATALPLILALAGLTACEAPSGGGSIVGQDQVDGTPQTIPPGGGTNPDGNTDPGNGPTPQIGPSCHSADADRICLSLKYVAYRDGNGAPTVSQAQTLTNLTQINRIWSACDIAFEIGQYEAIDPSDYGLNYNTPTSAELSTIRRQLVGDDTLLVVTTGTWAGTLGAGSANAWTSMPGGGPYGVVLEEPVGDFPNIVAHELGHYLNLDHYSSTTNVMNPQIGTASTGLTSAQCSAARSAAVYYWSAMQR